MPALTFTPTWDIDRVSQVDAANWVEYTTDDQVRAVTIRNETPAGSANRVRVGPPGVSGVFSSAHRHHDLGPGECVRITMSPGRGRVPAGKRSIMISVDTNPTVVAFLQEG